MSSKYIYHLTALLFFLLYYIFRGQLNYYSSKDFITILNVNQGDAILVSSVGESVLIDSGPSSYSLFNVKDYLLDKKPQIYVATHLHSDHISGFNYFLPKSPLIISNCITLECNKIEYTTGPVRENLRPFSFLNNKQIGNFKFTILYPTNTCDDTNLNNCSLALLAVHIPSGKKALLLADNDSQIQQNYLHQVGDVYLLKIPHHGGVAALNVDLANKSHPKIAVISVGKNSYGHPSQKVIDYYESIGTKVLRTDREGDVVVEF
ncbi:MBL fold metallo-hydrolase [Patescibacteria group bacterium]|nr:MBL fold metallo-hydrolase [Patescibacteria group bacterium]